MIGMSQIKKRLFTGIAIGGAVGVVGIGLTIWWSLSTIKSYEAGTNKNYIKNYTQEVAVLTRDVIQGEVIDNTMVKNVRIHNSTVPASPLSSGSIIGQVANFNIPANIPITQAMVTTEIVASDVREQELNMVVMPSDINVGDFVDLRIMYPNGTDYIVLVAKQIKNVTEQTMWIDINEDERLLLSGSIVDSYLNPGTKLYATKYIDAATQKTGSNTDVDLAREYISTQYNQELQAIAGSTTGTDVSATILDLIVKYKNFAAVVSKSSVNYQPNETVIQMMKTNPNVLQQAKDKLSSEARANMESALNSYKSQNTEQFNNIVTGAQQNITTQKNERTDILNGQ